MRVKTLSAVILTVVALFIVCSVSVYALVSYGSVAYTYPIGDATMRYTQDTQPYSCIATTSIDRSGGSTHVTVLAVGEFKQTLSDGTVLTDTKHGFGDGGSGATASISCPFNGEWTDVYSTHYAQYDGEHISKTIP